MPANDLAPIEQLLKDRIGLEPAALGPKAVAWAVTERLRRLGLTSLAAYAHRLAKSAQELEALIELVVVPETWFFRDRAPFNCLADFIRSEWIPRRGQETLRILSAPCASGEEPYSIAITCLEAGLAAGRFSVHAMDINAGLLVKARAARYGRNSFRGTDPLFRERHFTFDGRVYALKAEVRAGVRFFKGNIVAPLCLIEAPPYHVVFCRNLLIYLHEPARERTIATLDRLLAAGGLLFIGHAELTPALTRLFATVNYQGAFALRKKNHA